jgi:3-methyladenine DNA glycosylase AlkD
MKKLPNGRRARAASSLAPTGPPKQSDTSRHVRDALSWLDQRGTARNREGMARYAIVAPKVFGVSVATVRQLARTLGRDHALALALWKSGWYEARLLAAFVDEPALVTPAQMDAWARDFDNWAVCDTACFHLFDRTPHAWGRIRAWSTRRQEFVRRASFALLASVALHDKAAPDASFERALRLIERASTDDRNFVKKAVNWALRGIGGRNARLHAPALALAQSLAESENATARWIGKDAVRGLTSRATMKRLARPPR